MARRPLGEILVAHGRATRAEIQDALVLQQSAPTRLRLGRILVQEGVIDETTLADALAESHGLPSINLALLQVPYHVARLLPRDVALRFGMVPVEATEDHALVAVSDPVDVLALDELRSRLPHHNVQVAVAPGHQIQDLLLRAWGEEQKREVIRQLAADAPPEEPALPASEVGAAAVVTQLLTTAAQRRASDIHIEPQSDGIRVRLRVDGVMRELMRLPKGSLPSVTARIKIISGLDVFERRAPQDGRTKLRIDGNDRDVRVSTLPAIHGENVVMRLLPSQGNLPPLSQLGLTPAQLRMIRETVMHPQGMMLVTGPTGAGKSNTLYAAVVDTIDDQRNVVTVEDPVEIEINGITQVQVSEPGGVSFEQGVRAALRQDPDVLLIGEIRDTVTGNLAVRAALTGHLVLSTLHTNDAPSAVARLIDLGVPRYLVATSLSLVVAQRLLRRNCTFCAGPHRPDADVCRILDLSPGVAGTMVAGTGCTACDGTGYRGRIGVFEILRVDAAFRSAVSEGADEKRLRELARAHGWRRVADQALDLALQGITTPEEILRATMAEADRERDSAPPGNPT